MLLKKYRVKNNSYVEDPKINNDCLMSDNEDWAAVISYYDKCATTIGDSAKAMGWSSLFNQTLRFDVLNLMVDLSEQSLLDVGCGDGALFHYLESQQINCDYKGIDISKKMVRRAQDRHAGIPIQQANFYDISQKSDVVFCSGGLSVYSTNDPYEFLYQSIDHLFSLANKHLVFNLLSTLSESKDDLFNYYDPVKVMEYCFTLTPFVTLSHTYLPNDFTLHLVKND